LRGSYNYYVAKKKLSNSGYDDEQKYGKIIRIICAELIKKVLKVMGFFAEMFIAVVHNNEIKKQECFIDSQLYVVLSLT